MYDKYNKFHFQPTDFANKNLTNFANKNLQLSLENSVPAKEKEYHIHWHNYRREINDLPNEKKMLEKRPALDLLY